MDRKAVTKVLLVEDDPQDAFLVTRALSRPGDYEFTVQAASCLKEAICRAHQEHFDIALLDLKLPDSIGYDTVTKLQEAAPFLPILVLTGSDTEDIAIETMRRGAQDCLIKGKAEPPVLKRVIRYAIERKVLLERVLRQNERLKELDRLKDEFVSVVTHELRTPMTAIKIALSMLESGPADLRHPENQESLQMLGRNADRLLKLINEVLDVSRIESGHLQLKVQEADLVCIVREVLGLMAPQAHERKCHLAADFVDECVYVQCDRDKTMQVLLNLVSNAMLHNDPGLEVAVGARHDGAQVRVWVRDNGKGISEEEQKRIFQPYYQIRPQGEPYSKGTGLGLAIARGLVKAHRKRLALKSRPGEGSEFSFELDALPVQELKVRRAKTWTVKDLVVTAELYEHGVKLSFKGMLFGLHSQTLLEITQEILSRWSPWIALDLAECTHIDSRGIGYLLECRALAMELGGSTALVNLSPNIKQVLLKIGLLNSIPHFLSLATAMRALKRDADNPHSSTKLLKSIRA